MERVQMTANWPKTQGYGPLKEGKRYALPGGLVRSLVDAGVAVRLSSPPTPSFPDTETATVEPPENAAKRTSRAKAKKPKKAPKAADTEPEDEAATDTED